MFKKKKKKKINGHSLPQQIWDPMMQCKLCIGHIYSDVGQALLRDQHLGLI